LRQSSIPNRKRENAMTELVESALAARSARASRLADAELAHLEAVLKHMARSTGSTGPATLEYAYWVKRVDWVFGGFNLLPVQLSRAQALLRLLKSFDHVPSLSRRTAA
jgi:hypothetical protein